MEQMQLKVIEISGTARGGKGTVANHTAETHEGVAIEETGADYRTVAFSLYETKTIDPDMSSGHIRSQVAELDPEDLTSIVARRYDIVEEYGLESLYTPTVNSLVASVASVDVVRGAVKAGFIQRVEKVRDNEHFHTLIVDGRNLAPTVRKIEGADLILRMFVTCDNVEAATRECARNGVDLKSPEGFAILSTIRNRNIADASRELDPVRPDNDAIDYWQSGPLPYGTDLTPLSTTYFGPGIVATSSRRQLLLDTTPFRTTDNPKEAMLAATDAIYAEAQAAHRLLTEGRVYHSLPQNA